MAPEPLICGSCLCQAHGAGRADLVAWHFAIVLRAPGSGAALARLDA